MGKTEFLDALKRALPGLPPAIQARTLAYYEQQFVDGAASGRAEDDIARDLGAPSQIAMALRASVHESKLTPAPSPSSSTSSPLSSSSSSSSSSPSSSAPAQPFATSMAPRRGPGVLRTCATAVGLGFFNLFMVAPAAVVAALVACVFAAALTFYVGGIAITASGLAGANDLVLRTPLRAFGVDDANRTRIAISTRGIEVGEEATPETANDPAREDGPARDGEQDQGKSQGQNQNQGRGQDQDQDQASDDGADPARVVRRAEAVAGRGLHISTSLDESSRATQAVIGMGMVTGGIVLFLLGLVGSRYSWLGARRYLQMNMSLLRGR